MAIESVPAWFLALGLLVEKLLAEAMPLTFSAVQCLSERFDGD